MIAMRVGAGNDDRKRSAILLDKEAALGPFFAAVCGIGSDALAAKPRLAKRPVGGLPLPIYGAERVAGLDKSRPETVP